MVYMSIFSSIVLVVMTRPAPPWRVSTCQALFNCQYVKTRSCHVVAGGRGCGWVNSDAHCSTIGSVGVQFGRETHCHDVTCLGTRVTCPETRVTWRFTWRNKRHHACSLSDFTLNHPVNNPHSLTHDATPPPAPVSSTAPLLLPRI